MAIANYADLKSALTNWMARLDLAGEAADFITLGEARLNRELDPVEMNTTLTGTLDSRLIDITALSCSKPIALFLAQTGLNEAELTPKAEGTFPIISQSGRPRYWARNQETLVFDRALDAAYPFRFRFSQKFSLSDSATTNWLLTNHPDVYLAAMLVWGGLFIRDNTYAAQFQAVLNSGLKEVRGEIAKSKRGNLTVDPLLQRINQPLRGTYNAGTIDWPI